MQRLVTRKTLPKLAAGQRCWQGIAVNYETCAENVPLNGVLNLLSSYCVRLCNVYKYSKSALSENAGVFWRSWNHCSMQIYNVSFRVYVGIIYEWFQHGCKSAWLIHFTTHYQISPIEDNSATKNTNLLGFIAFHVNMLKSITFIAIVSTKFMSR